MINIVLFGGGVAKPASPPAMNDNAFGVLVAGLRRESLPDGHSVGGNPSDLIALLRSIGR